MKPVRSATLAVLPLAIVLVACARSNTADGEGESSEPSPSVAGHRSFEPVASGDVGRVPGNVPDEVVAAIVADAARQTGVDAGAIDVVRAESVTWNDGSLGCPEPGTMYTQALVDGYHVVLDVDGEPLDYRADGGGGFRICEDPLPGASGDG